MNKNYQMITSEQDIVTNWLSGNTTPTSVVVEDNNFINIYNDWCDRYDLDDLTYSKKKIHLISILSNAQIYKTGICPEYKEMNIQEYRSQVCNTATTRLYILEMNEYNTRGMIPVLKFLKY